MRILQLSPTIPLETPLGKADAHFMIDYGREHSLLFVTFLRKDGACWTWPSTKVSMEANVTMGTGSYLPAYYAKKEDYTKPRCNKTNPGDYDGTGGRFYCSREEGHAGPCATHFEKRAHEQEAQTKTESRKEAVPPVPEHQAGGEHSEEGSLLEMLRQQGNQGLDPKQAERGSSPRRAY